MGREKLFELEFEQIEIDIKGDKYIVKEMNAKDAGEYESSLYTVVGQTVKYNTKNAKEKLVLRTLCEVNGDRIFGDNDIALIGKLPASVVDKVFQIASKLNGLEKEGTEKNL